MLKVWAEYVSRHDQHHSPLTHAYDLVDWSDNTRDILNFLLNYLPTSPTSSRLPTHLSRVSHVESERRKVSGFGKRTLIAVGHSYGGCTSYVFPSISFILSYLNRNITVH
jgi:hypothetical protein